MEQRSPANYPIKPCPKWGWAKETSFNAMMTRGCNSTKYAQVHQTHGRSKSSVHYCVYSVSKQQAPLALPHWLQPGVTWHAGLGTRPKPTTQAPEFLMSSFEWLKRLHNHCCCEWINDILATSATHSTASATENATWLSDISCWMSLPVAKRQYDVHRHSFSVVIIITQRTGQVIEHNPHHCKKNRRNKNYNYSFGMEVNTKTHDTRRSKHAYVPVMPHKAVAEVSKIGNL
jgi:hypothetical protein